MYTAKNAEPKSTLSSGDGAKLVSRMQSGTQVLGVSRIATNRCQSWQRSLVRRTLRPFWRDPRPSSCLFVGGLRPTVVEHKGKPLGIMDIL
jgi:hypothetical protein